MLPVGVRPIKQELWCIPATNGTARVDLFPDGGNAIANYSPSGNNGWVCLDSVIMQSPSMNGLKPIRPPLSNSWVQFDSPETTWSNLRYGINRNGAACLWGMIANGNQAAAWGAGGIIPGYRPVHQEIFVGAAALGGSVRVDVGNDGSLTIGGYFLGGYNAWVGLHHRWFPASTVRVTG
jgi:hypothetical protein